MDSPLPAPAGLRRHLLRAAIYAAIALPVLMVVFPLAKYSLMFPYYEEWYLIAAVAAIPDGQWHWGIPWIIFGEQRYLLPVPLFIFVGWLTGATTWPLQLLSVFFSLSAVAVLASVWLRIVQGRPGVMAILVLLGVTGSIFTCASFDAWSWGWYAVTWMHGLFICIAARALSGGVPTVRRFWAALTATLGACATFTSGILFWPVGFLALVLPPWDDWRRRIWMVAAWCTVALAVVLVAKFVPGFLQVRKVEGQRDSLLWIFAYLGAMPATILGWPYTEENVRIARLLGATVFALWMWVAAMTIARRDRIELAGLWLSLFALGMGAAIWFGRSSTLGPLIPLTPRYLSYTSYFYSGLLLQMLALYYGPRVGPAPWARTGAVRRCLALAVVVIVGMNLLGSFNHRKEFAGWNERYHEQEIAFVEGRYDPSLRKLMPIEEHAREVLRLMLKHRLSIYAERGAEDWPLPSTVAPRSDDTATTAAAATEPPAGE